MHVKTAGCITCLTINRGHYKPQAEALAKKVRLLEEALAQSRAANQELLAERQQMQGQARLLDVASTATSVGLAGVNASQQSAMRMDIDDTPTVFTVPAPAPVLLPAPSSGIAVPSLLSQSLPATSTVTSTEPSLMPPPSTQIAPQRVSHDNPVQLVMDHGNIVFSRAASPIEQQESRDDQQPLPTETTTAAVGIPFPFPSDRPRLCCCADLDLTPPLVDYLLGLFFHRYQMMLKFVSQEDFMRKHAASSSDGTRHNHHNHSPLFLAMLAAGVRYSTRRDVTARFLLANGENKLATAARQAVEIEVGRPALATVQTVLILCEVETSLDHQMTGYMYSCLASKMIYGMGIDLGQIAPAVRETMSAEEKAIRHWLVWAASVHDQFWSVFLRRPLAIKNGSLQASRMVWRNTGSGLSPLTPAFEDEVNDNLMDLMILAREITDALYGASNTISNNATGSGRQRTELRFDEQQEPMGNNTHDQNDSTSPPCSPPYDGGGLPSALYEQAAQRHACRQRPDVALLDARLGSWFNNLSDRVRQGPINGHSSYHYLFILHLHYNATKIMLHRTRAFSAQATPLQGSDGVNKSHASVPVSSYPLQSPVTPPASSSGDANTPGLPPQQQPAMNFVDHATAQSIATLGRASISMARLFESFRRRDDVRMLQSTGVQWAGMASEALTWYIETLPIDGAIEAVAHLQSLARTLKDMAKTFRPAVYPYDRTSHAIQMFQARMDSSVESPRLESWAKPTQPSSLDTATNAIAAWRFGDDNPTGTIATQRAIGTVSNASRWRDESIVVVGRPGSMGLE
ncbi:hypothetical protein Sste5344_004509 [Sporothrix stenoceras]